MEKSIAELVELAKTGDQEAMTELYNQTKNSVYQSVRALMQDEDEALDVVQDSYIKGFQNLDKLKEPEKFAAWMRAIAANLAKDYLRKNRPALFSERVDEEGREIDLRQADDCLEHMPEAVIDRKETARLMNEILGKLSQEQRLAIIMYYYENMSIREIARELNCSENTVKSRMNYGRKKIEAEVLALEKRGTKLYSLAPMPFFLWLLRLAKTQSVSVTRDGIISVAAATTAAAEEVSAAAGAAAAGNSASATAAAGTAAKAAGTAAGKTVATKIVAGTLAATMTVGAGVAVVSGMGGNKENKAAHGVYEEFLDRYEYALEADHDLMMEDQHRFWQEISQDILQRNPELDLGVIHHWHMDYIPGEGLSEDIPLPDTVYEPNMDYLKIIATYLEDEEIRYAYRDLDEDGVDELVIAKFYRDELIRSSSIDVYAVRDGEMYRGEVDWGRKNGVIQWTVQDTRIADYVKPGVVYIHLGNGYFDESLTVEEPDLDWQVLYRAEQEETAGEETEAPETTVETEETEPEETVDPYAEAIERLAGTYRYYIPLGNIVVSHTRVSGTAFHEFRVTVTDEEIIIEDLGEPQESVDNRSAFVQRLEENGYTMKEEDYQNIVFGNLGTMRIDRSSIHFLEDTLANGRVISSSIMTFDATRFEGPTAPTGYVDAMRMDVLFFHYNHSGNHTGLMMSHGINYQRYSWVHGIDLDRYDNG